MAGDWIKWVKGLVRRREVIAVANALGADRRIVACSAMLLWEWADDNTTDGHVEGIGASDIDAIADLPGFGAALKSVGWLRVTARGITIVNFEHHNGESAKARALNQKHQQASRKRKESVRESSDKTVTRAEQSSREQRREENTKQQAGAPPPACSPQPAAAAPIHSTGGLCSLLLALKCRGAPVFDAKAAAAIAQHPKATFLQVSWAAERFHDEMRTEAGRARVKNKAGWVRRLIEEQEPPPGWAEKFNRRILADLAKQANATFEAQDKPAAKPARTEAA